MDSRRYWTIAHYRVRTAWRDQMTKAVRRSGLIQTLLQSEARARFYTFYTHLRALPRHARRVLQHKRMPSLAGVALLLALGQDHGLAATINVTGGCTLVNAITSANTDAATGGCIAGGGTDTVVLETGSMHTLTSVHNTTYDATGLPVVTSTITIEGNGSTISRKSNAPDFRLLAVGSIGDLTLNNLTLTKGAGVIGAGVYNYGVLTITNCTISGNTADAAYDSYGGGVFSSGTLSITSSTIADNIAKGTGYYLAEGGGIWNDGILTITNSLVSGNSARGGNKADGSCGGVFGRGNVTITNSTISSNAAKAGNYSGGGGVCSRSATDTLTITNSTISGNIADGGNKDDGNCGGVLSRGHLAITNSTISGNTVTAGYYSGGGGVCSRGRSDTQTITNSTISGNKAGAEGGGVFVSGFLRLTRTLISGNTAPNGREVYNFLGTVTADAFNLFGHTGDAGISGFSPGVTDLVPNGDLLTILDPILAANGGPTLTHALSNGSPALNAAGPSCPPPATDQRGVFRPQGTSCDMAPSSWRWPARRSAATASSRPASSVIHQAGAVLPNASLLPPAQFVSRKPAHVT